MAETTTSDMLVPEILAETMQTGFSGLVALNGTPAAVVAPGLPGDARGGKVVQVPRLSNLGDFEEVAEGIALTPVGLTMTSDEATVKRFGKAFSQTYWTQLAAAYADPYGAASRMMLEGVGRAVDKGLIDAARAPGADLLSLDISALQGGASKPSYDALVDARALWGDESDDVVLIGCHSKTYASLHKIKDSQGRPLLVDPVDGKLATFGGIPVKVSDRFAPTGDVYETFLFKRESVACWMNNVPSIGTDEDILKDEQIAAVNVYFACVRYAKANNGTKCGVVQLKHKV